MAARPLNYTTKIQAAQTAGECQAILAKAGASSVAVHYEDGSPAGLSFALKTPHGMRNFTLPVDVTAMQAALVKAERDGMFAQTSKGTKAHVGRNTFTNREHAENVAWRVVKDWLEANLALIAAQMATLSEVMLPYLHVDEGRTLWQAYREREEAAALLPGGSQ
jgi:hypothetical protein